MNSGSLWCCPVKQGVLNVYWVDQVKYVIIGVKEGYKTDDVDEVRTKNIKR